MLNADNHVDWFAAGKIGPVKEQGQCGACWAFAGTSVLEAMIAIRDNTYPKRLSEQQGLDCEPYGYGCNGSFMFYYWQYCRGFGALRYDNYPTGYNAL